MITFYWYDESGAILDLDVLRYLKVSFKLTFFDSLMLRCH